VSELPPAKRNDRKIDPNEKLPTGQAPPKNADLAASYNWSIALLNSDPELRRLFRQAVKQGWNANRFSAELQDTKWFQKHSSSWRKNETQRIVDPASWNAARKGNRATVEDLAARMGAHLTGPEMQKFADTAMALGWNQSQLQNQLGKYIQTAKEGPSKGNFTGAAGTAFTEIKKAALRNGYDIPSGKANQWVADIATGKANVEDIAQMMRESAARAYPALHNELIAGADLDDLASPYKNKMAEILEIPPDRIDLKDRTLQKALSAKDDKGKWTTMALYDFEDQLRKDDRWQYTNNAKDTVMSEVMRLGRTFGRTG
jgi:hypothetical protein